MCCVIFFNIDNLLLYVFFVETSFFIYLFTSIYIHRFWLETVYETVVEYCSKESQNAERDLGAMKYFWYTVCIITNLQKLKGSLKRHWGCCPRLATKTRQ